MRDILLICGTGASSGFMAKKIRQAAKARGYILTAKARGDAEAEEYLEEIDCLLVGPHLHYMLHDLEEMAEPYGVPVRLISEEIYGSLDGEKVIDFLEKEFGPLNEEFKEI